MVAKCHGLRVQLKITSMEKSKMFFAWASQDRNGSVDFSFLSSLKAFVTLRTVLGVDRCEK